MRLFIIQASHVINEHMQKYFINKIKYKSDKSLTVRQSDENFYSDYK